MEVDSATAGADESAAERAGVIVGRFVDQLVEIEREVAKLQARKAWLVDQARMWSQLAIDAIVDASRSATSSAASSTSTSTSTSAASASAAASSAATWSSSMSAARREELSGRSLTSEIACALRLPDVTAGRLLDESETLVHELPATRAALSAGSLSYRHAQVVIDQARSLPPEARGEFESAVLPSALTTTASQFSRKARAEREQRHPESMVSRARKAAEDRHVSFEPDRDGMAWLHHYLPAVDAVRIDDTLEQLAHALRDRASGDPRDERDGTRDGDFTADSAGSAGSEGSAGSAETRTLSQLKSDVLRDLLLSDPATGEPRTLRPTVIVTVPVMTLLGHSETPASLDGYGPIDAETARELCRHAPSFLRLLTHPETGATLSVGRDHYRPPAELKVALHVDDQTCRFPGCSRRTTQCDIDHTRDWQHGGSTDFTNLAHLCPKHHHLKHETAWSVSIDRDRTLHWRSPAGKSYETHSASRGRSLHHSTPYDLMNSRDPNGEDTVPARAAATTTEPPPF